MLNNLSKYKFTTVCFYWCLAASLAVLIIFSSFIASPVLASSTLDGADNQVSTASSILPPSKNDVSESKSSTTSEDVKPSAAIDVEPAIHKKSLKEQFLSAKKRYQPYINLTDQIYSLADLLNPAVFNEYKKLGLKSLYLRTNKLSLGAQFVLEINELIKTGIRELVIIFYQDQPSITTEQFNRFIEENKIYINLILIPVTKKDIESIRADSIGKKDLLGFKNFLGNKIVYRDGYSVSLLNNEESSKIILRNYVEHTRRAAKTAIFTAQEPKYLTDTSDSTSEKRIKDPKAIKKPFSVEVNKVTDLNAQAEKQEEEESELDLDREQADNKFDENTAGTRAERLVLQYFYEEEQNRYKSVNKENIRPIISSIFRSTKDMKFITSKALDLVVQNWFLFRDGIDMENLPIGLVYKDQILFASDQRRSAMPINEFTVKLDPIRSYISNPNEYSWLPFATKASISLNDIYRSEIAPDIYGSDKHPAIKSDDQDIMLDIPYNAYNADYEFRRGHTMYLMREYLKHFFIKNTEASRRVFLDVFPGIYFYDLSPSDRQKLKEIYANLQERGLEEVFSNIVVSESGESSSLVSDG